MYIPIWALILAIILIYFIVDKRCKKIETHINLLSDTGKENLPPYSYRLNISLEPNWDRIYEKIANPKSQAEFSSLLAIKIKEAQKNPDMCLWGRRYEFTEYYNSTTGLIARYQKVISWDGTHREFDSVKEFGDGGFMFESDNTFAKEQTEKEREEKNRLTVNINEDFIAFNIFDPYVGGPKGWPDKEDLLWTFPLNDVFNFHFSLGQRFYGLGDYNVVKWPDYIEEKFKNLGIKYETFFDNDPEIFDFEKEDKKLFEKLGKPQITLNNWRAGSYLSSDLADYGLRLELFHPNENDRINL